MSASEKSSEFQLGFILRGGIPLLLNMLSTNSFLGTADIPTKRYAFILLRNFTLFNFFFLIRSAYLSILRLSKVVLAVMSNLCLRNLVESQTAVLQTSSPCIATDNVVRAVAGRLAQHMQSDTDATVLLGGVKPDAEVVRSLIRLAWASSSGDYQLLDILWDELGSMKPNNTAIPIQENEYSEDILLCKYVNIGVVQLGIVTNCLFVYFSVHFNECFREALEVLTVVNSITPRALQQVSQNPTFYRFSLEMILLCPVKSLRVSAAEQFLLISSQLLLPHGTPLPGSPSMLTFFLDLLFSVMTSTVPEYAKHSQEFFQLLCRLLNYAATSHTPLPSAEPLLLNEINWLQRIRVFQFLRFRILYGNVLITSIFS